MLFRGRPVQFGSGYSSSQDGIDVDSDKQSDGSNGNGKDSKPCPKVCSVLTLLSITEKTIEERLTVTLRTLGKE